MQMAMHYLSNVFKIGITGDVYPKGPNGAQLKLLVEHRNLLNLIYEAVHKSAKVPEERVERADNVSEDLERKLRLTTILAAIFLILSLAFGLTLVAATVLYVMYPEKAMRLQDRFVKGYANSFRFVVSGGWVGETLEGRYKREKQESNDLEEEKKRHKLSAGRKGD